MKICSNQTLLEQCHKIAKQTCLLFGTIISFLLGSLCILLLTLPHFFETGWMALSIACWVFLLFLSFFLLAQYDQGLKEKLEHLAAAFRSPPLPASSLQTWQQIGHTFERTAALIESNNPSQFIAPRWLPWIQPLLDLASAFLIKRYFSHLKAALLLQAVKTYLMAIREFPTDISLHLRLSKVYLALYSQGAKAQKEIMRLSALQESQIVKDFLEESQCPPLWLFLSLAENAILLEKPQDAILFYERALNYYPDHLELTLALGKLYFQEKWYAKGLHLYEKLQTLNPIMAKELLEGYHSPFLKI